MNATPDTLDDRIVVTGLGLVSPLGIGGDAYWARAAAGESGVRPTTLFATDGLPCRLAGEVPAFDPTAYLPKKGLRNLNRAIVFARTAAKNALDAAGFAQAPPDPASTAVVLGTNGSCTSQMLEFDRDAGRGFVDPLMFPNTGVSAPACQISVFEGFHCQTSTMSSGHAAGIEALTVGAQILRNHEASIVIAGGVEELCAATYAAAACSGRLYRDDGPANGQWPGPFGGGGVVPGEGSACLILEREEDARARHARPLAEIAGASSRFDPEAFTTGRPCVQLMVDVIQEALQDSGLEPGGIDGVISGAQGDPCGDAAEAEALARVFGPHGVPITTACAAFGDTHGALGAFEAASAVLAMQHGMLVGRANEGHPTLDLVSGTRSTSGRAYLLTAFGSLGERMAMVLKSVAAVILALVLTQPSAFAQSHGGSQNADVTALKTLMRDFTTAYETRDLDGVMKTLSESDDLALFLPNPFEPMLIQGRTTARTLIGTFFESIPPSAIVRMTTHEDGYEVYGDLAVNYNYTNIYLSVGGMSQKFIARTTNIFRRANGRWTIVHIHGSALPKESTYITTQAR
jgi:3-oxoacyl-(acyl-carrier-protein) synthase/ketosteroid isomerase-like protein